MNNCSFYLYMAELLSLAFGNHEDAARPQADDCYKQTISNYPNHTDKVRRLWKGLACVD